jgi:hypothetical protein
MNRRPWPADQLTNLRQKIEKVALAPGPAQELAVLVAALIQHVTESDKRIAALERKPAGVR